jgi:hypothetical protein
LAADGSAGQAARRSELSQTGPVAIDAKLLYPFKKIHLPKTWIYLRTHEVRRDCYLLALGRVTGLSPVPPSNSPTSIGNVRVWASSRTNTILTPFIPNSVLT